MKEVYFRIRLQITYLVSFVSMRQTTQKLWIKLLRSKSGRGVNSLPRDFGNRSECIVLPAPVSDL